MTEQYEEKVQNLLSDNERLEKENDDLKSHNNHK